MSESTRYDKERGYSVESDEGLSVEMARMDVNSRYDVHQAIWWNTDTPIPMAKRMRADRRMKLAVPLVWKSAPRDILDELLRTQVGAWHNYATIEGKVLREYMRSKQFVNDLRKLSPPIAIARDACVSEARREANVLLSDRPSKTKDIVVCWREEGADLLFSPIASTNQYARVIWLDPVLKKVPQDVLNWVVYHEFCTIVSLSMGNGKPKKHMLALLEERFPDRASATAVLDAEGYRFEYDTRFYEQRKDSDNPSDGAEDEVA